MTHSEPERLALELTRLIERRNTLRAILSHRALQSAITDSERADLYRVIDIIDREKAELERRLADLLNRDPGGKG